VALLRVAGSAENRKDSMSGTLRRALFPLAALAAVWLAGAGARAEDAGPPAGGFGLAPESETREAATAPRLYVPLQPAEPREVEQEFPPLRATTFGPPPAAGASRETGAGPRGLPPGPDPTAIKAPAGR
jgi:hypothetical protein